MQCRPLIHDDKFNQGRSKTALTPNDHKCLLLCVCVCVQKRQRIKSGRCEWQHSPLSSVSPQGKNCREESEGDSIKNGNKKITRPPAGTCWHTIIDVSHNVAASMSDLKSWDELRVKTSITPRSSNLPASGFTVKRFKRKYICRKISYREEEGRDTHKCAHTQFPTVFVHFAYKKHLNHSCECTMWSSGKKQALMGREKRSASTNTPFSFSCIPNKWISKIKRIMSWNCLQPETSSSCL